MVIMHTVLDVALQATMISACMIVVVVPLAYNHEFASGPPSISQGASTYSTRFQSTMDHSPVCAHPKCHCLLGVLCIWWLH